jgi:hypothetical protein
MCHRCPDPLLYYGAKGERGRARAGAPLRSDDIASARAIADRAMDTLRAEFRTAQRFAEADALLRSFREAQRVAPTRAK